MQAIAARSRIRRRHELLKQAPWVYGLHRSSVFPFMASAPILLLNAHHAVDKVPGGAAVPVVYDPLGALPRR